MYAIIEPRNEPEIIRPLGDDDILDCEIYADEYAHDLGVTIAAADGYIPNGCGDITVTLLEDLETRYHIWTTADYFLDITE